MKDAAGCESLARTIESAHVPTTFERIPAIIRNQGWKRFLVQSKNYLSSRAFGRLRARYALPRLRAQAAKIGSMNEALDFAYSFKSWGIKICPFQNRHEIEVLAQRVFDIKPERVVEIGTGWGGTLFLFCVASSPDAVLTSIDLPPSILGRGYPKWKDPLYKSFARGRQKVELVRGNSHDSQTATLVRDKVKGKPVDILFIDGDHTYAGVKTDFELYAPLVRSGGMIALHDIVPNASNKEIEVFRFWNEIRENHKTEEIIFERDQAGIGVAYVG